ncbi:hypothetical protein ORV05_07865 [Amycolatopsis cynarae]|uniref:Uncharacterized protein n=1 Tax=Amycolatopsis cynarae TaxID=2995223 RepID=A0ABY7B699_9PSEU|nr:hypothetical protein [Amycolatopsis sp. HUAS 11-8]WAL67686.1 hypothetical protein ORV05_07865 [Amycolatopsis sp. HUAS 11-8]
MSTTEPVADSQSTQDPAAAKCRVGAAARAVLDDILSFAQRAVALLSTSDALRESGLQQATILTKQRARAALKDRPVIELRDLVGKGARLGAGYRSVSAVVLANPQQLEAVPGIGLQTAHQVSAAARCLSQEVRQETRVRLDPDRQYLGQTQLLATPPPRHADSAHSRLQDPLYLFITRTTQLVEESEPTTSRVAMFFYGRAEKMATHRARQTRSNSGRILDSRPAADRRTAEKGRRSRLLHPRPAVAGVRRRCRERSEHHPVTLDDEAIPLKERIILAERHRLGVQS